MKFFLKNKLVLSVVTLFLVAGGLSAAYISTKNDNSSPPQVTDQQNQDSEVSEPKKDPVKPSLSSDNPIPSNEPVSGLKIVTPVITSSGQYGNVVEVGSRVPNIIEDGGVCTLSLTRGSAQAVSASRKGTANASETSCGFISITRSKLTAGTWMAVITYSSSKAKGSSSSVPINVK